MSQLIRLRTQRAGGLPAGALRAPVLFSAVSLLALLGCSGEVVNLGEDTNPRPAPPSYSRCVDSPTLAGDVVVSDQAQLDALEGCETILGDVSVLPLFEADLRPLHALKVVAGQLVFSEVPRAEGGAWSDSQFDLDESSYERWLVSLEGLEALTSVGSLTIWQAAVPDLAPLSGLRQLTGNGELWLNLRNVRDLAPLAQLQGIRSLNISGARLESIADLQLPSTLSALRLDGEALTELDPLSQLREVPGGLELSRIGVRDLTSLANLEYVGSLLLWRLPFLESLNGLEHLTVARDGVGISENPLLENIEGLTSLQLTASLEISSNQSLRRIPDFPALPPLKGLVIRNNAALEQIAEFSGFVTTQIHHLSDGTTFREPVVENPGKYYRRPDLIIVSDNPALRSFAIPAGWEGGRYVEIRNNVSLETLALGDLEAIDRLEISEHSSLHAVDLGVLDTVDSLSVHDNPLLSPASFDGVRTFEREMAGNAGQPPTPSSIRTPTP